LEELNKAGAAANAAKQKEQAEFARKQSELDKPLLQGSSLHKVLLIGITNEFA